MCKYRHCILDLRQSKTFYFKVHVYFTDKPVTKHTILQQCRVVVFCMIRLYL